MKKYSIICKNKRNIRIQKCVTLALIKTYQYFCSMSVVFIFFNPLVEQRPSPTPSRLLCPMQFSSKSVQLLTEGIEDFIFLLSTHWGQGFDSFNQPMESHSTLGDWKSRIWKMTEGLTK